MTVRQFLRTCALAAAVAGSGCATDGANEAAAPDAGQQVLALEAGAAMVLAEQGFAAYAELFHPEYTNWSGGAEVLGREAFLAAVRGWYDAGNRAVCTAIQPLSVDVVGDVAYSRYLMREEFNDGTLFVGRFASLARRDSGRWRLYRTSFSTTYRGARSEAPPGLAPAQCDDQRE